LDPRWDLLPGEIRRRHGGGDLATMAAAFEEFALRMLDVVAPLVPVVKPQSAFFEACGPAGLDALQGGTSAGAAGGEQRARHVADAVGSWARENLGRCGLGDVGAVVGATHPAELAAVRQALPEVVFLIPGYGAQGGTAADAAGGFRADGLGAVVNNSRGLTAC